jgi:uncharacterized protein (DUF983 family)
MMRLRRLLYALNVLKKGLRLRCPHCGRGKIFMSAFKAHDTCPYCQSRYERNDGDSFGGMYINISLAEITAIFGFFVVEGLTEIPAMWQLPFWVVYTIVFSLLFYRPARSLWIAIMYLTGGVYPDPDYMREYRRAETDVTPTSHHREHE